MGDRDVNRDVFYQAIAQEFQLDGGFTDDLRLDADLDFDSLAMFDLVLFIEELAGVASEDQGQMDYPMLNTLGDAHAYWEALNTHVGSMAGSHIGSIP
jgi:acyl carrier protein